MRCNLWQDGAYCLAETERAYLPGPRCPEHTPAALAGRPETIPDPARTLDGIRAAKGLTFHQLPAATVIDEKAIASGKRRSNPRAYRDARNAQDNR